MTELKHSLSVDSLSDGMGMRSPRDSSSGQGLFGTSLQQLLIDSLGQKNNPKKLVPEWIMSSSNFLMNAGKFLK